MTPLEKAVYITKFFDRLETETNGHIFAAFTLPTQKFNVQIHGHSYEWTIDETQCFVIGWNARNNRTQNLCKHPGIYRGELCPVCGAIAQ